jgi:hypothetical protein
MKEPTDPRYRILNRCEALNTWIVKGGSLDLSEYVPPFLINIDM